MLPSNPQYLEMEKFVVLIFYLLHIYSGKVCANLYKYFFTIFRYKAKMCTIICPCFQKVIAHQSVQIDFFFQQTSPQILLTPLQTCFIKLWPFVKCILLECTIHTRTSLKIPSLSILSALKDLSIYLPTYIYI